MKVTENITFPETRKRFSSFSLGKYADAARWRAERRLVSAGTRYRESDFVPLPPPPRVDPGSPTHLCTTRAASFDCGGNHVRWGCRCVHRFLSTGPKHVRGHGGDGYGGTRDSLHPRRTACASRGAPDALGGRGSNEGHRKGCQVWGVRSAGYPFQI